MPAIIGLHHITVPTTDPVDSGDWYARLFGFTSLLVEEREDEVVAVLLEHAAGARLYLRKAPDQVAALRGFTLLGLAVSNRAALLQWAEYLTELGVDHSGPHEAHLGWALTVSGPDGLRIQLHTREALSGEGM
jgi:catechol 2,3-dioxygenase-like lactoylglutathione lyase family enzyme